MEINKIPLGKVFALLTKSYVGALSAKLSHLEIDRYFYLLYRIDGSPQPLTQSQLSELILQDKSAMVRIVDYLVERGMVKRIQNPDDRREYYITLTAKAEKLMPEIRNAFKELDESALNNLPESQLNHLYEGLQLISENLNTLPTTQVKIEVRRKSLKQSK